ncbi:very short patch repair endonuclease [Mucilaginibacter sp. SMC90]|uniref:very short patch repair endonuclease n=1 Tax=Mucilaginibacter sp. SMC90 TaxID=2929803 RepID=UPI001FB4BA99|nr:very short patch repair endonuclease [Mucilaginibacter sp. SMC90]UOE49148.1 very short patch repair endonuclease [Mucilaginibacter sp. SMC90]
MSRILSKDTKPELLVRKFLFGNGFRYRIHDKKLPGKPDIVFPKKKIAVFIHGCFWHSHQNCKYAVSPKSNTEYWSKKISNNVTRDRKNTDELLEKGWKIITVWECELKRSVLNQTMTALIKSISL